MSIFKVITANRNNNKFRVLNRFKLVIFCSEEKKLCSYLGNKAMMPNEKNLDFPFSNKVLLISTKWAVQNEKKTEKI